MKYIFIIAFSFVCCSYSFGSERETLNLESEDSYGYEEAIQVMPDQTVRKTIRKGKLRPREGAPEVGQIYESDELRLKKRIQSKTFTSVGFGPFQVSDGKENGILYGGSIAQHWEADSTGEIRLRLSGAGGSGGSFASLALGGALLPSKGSVSPLIGLEVGGGYLDNNRGSTGGFTGGIYLGLRMFRISDKQLELTFNYTAVFGEETPSSFGAMIAILF